MPGRDGLPCVAQCAVPQQFLLQGAAAALRRASGASCGAAPVCVTRRSFAACSAVEGEPSRWVTFAKDVAAGTVAGVAVVAVGHPFDTLKVLLQTQPCDKPIYTGVVDAFKVRRAAPPAGLVGRATCAQHSPAENRRFRRTRRPLQRRGGTLGGPDVLQARRTGLAQPTPLLPAYLWLCFRRAALFFSVARTKEFFNAGPENLLGYALAGSAAWGVATLAESPIDLYKSQMQKQLIQARLVRTCSQADSHTGCANAATDAGAGAPLQRHVGLRAQVGGVQRRDRRASAGLLCHAAAQHPGGGGVLLHV